MWGLGACLVLVSLRARHSYILFSYRLFTGTVATGLLLYFGQPVLDLKSYFVCHTMCIATLYFPAKKKHKSS